MEGFSAGTVVISFPTNTSDTVVDIVTTGTLPSADEKIVITRCAITIRRVRRRYNNAAFVTIKRQIVLSGLVRRIHNFLLNKAMRFFTSRHLMRSYSSSLRQAITFPPRRVKLHMRQRQPSRRRHILVNRSPLKLITLKCESVTYIVIIGRRGAQRVSFRSLYNTDGFQFNKPQ